MAQHIPKENGLDNSINVLREGYMYIPNRRHSFHSDIFETRILGQKSICMGGKEAAALFYDNEKRSEEHTSELQSRGHLVCRLLLEKKKTTNHRREAERHPNRKQKNTRTHSRHDLSR